MVFENDRTSYLMIHYSLVLIIIVYLLYVDQFIN